MELSIQKGRILKVTFSNYKHRKLFINGSPVPRNILLLLLLMLVWAVSLVSFPQEAVAFDREDPVSGASDVGSDYPLLSNEIPGMVIVLTQEQMRIRGYISLADILRDLPSFTTSGGFDNSPTFFSVDGEQSLQNEKFLLYIDGVLEQDLWQKSIWLSFQYSIAFIKNITVFYGSAATRFGANAMSAVIFIDTKKAEDLSNYGLLSLTKDVRNNMWSVDFMLGHSYNRRNTPKLAKNLFAWYIRGKFHFSEGQDSSYNMLWNPSQWDLNASAEKSSYYRLLRSSGREMERILAQYRKDYFAAYPKSTTAQLNAAVSSYKQRFFEQFQNDLANAGKFANPTYLNRNMAYNAELGIRFDNWFLRFFFWGMSVGEGLSYLPIRYQPNNSALWIRNYALSLHHLKSELWSSGVGEKAKVIYFNLNLTYRHHIVPGNSLSVLFRPHERVFPERKCIIFNEGTKTIPCTWQEYQWTPVYNYIISSSFRVEPKFDFRLFEGKWKFSLGINAGLSSLQGSVVTSNKPDPQLFANPNLLELGAGNQYDHTYMSGFFQSEIKFTSWLFLNVGLRSDWDLVRGRLETVANCDRALFPCFRFSSPIVSRTSFIFKPLKTLQMRVSYSYAFLSPSNQQLFGEGDYKTLDSRELLPQDKHSLELNVTAQIARKWFVTMSIFQHWLHNINSILVLPHKQDENQAVNIGNQETLGARFYSVLRVKWWMSIVTNFTLLYPRLDIRKLNEKVWLQDFPLFQAGLIVDWRTARGEQSHFFGSLRARLQTSRKNTGFNQKENGDIVLVQGEETGTQGVLDISAGYLWYVPRKIKFLRKLTILATVQNVLNLTQFDLGLQSGRAPEYNPLVPFPGINGFLRITTDF